MALKLSLKPNERIVINGCVIRNADKRQSLTIESRADVIRGQDLLSPEEASTPVKRVYFAIQTALTDLAWRDRMLKPIQKQLAILAVTFEAPRGDYAVEAATFVSTGDFYKALRALRPLMEHEAQLLASLERSAEEVEA